LFKKPKKQNETHKNFGLSNFSNFTPFLANGVLQLFFLFFIGRNQKKVVFLTFLLHIKEINPCLKKIKKNVFSKTKNIFSKKLKILVVKNRVEKKQNFSKKLKFLVVKNWVFHKKMFY
jgi:hypothetical protein